MAQIHDVDILEMENVKYMLRCITKIGPYGPELIWHFGT